MSPSTENENLKTVAQAKSALKKAERTLEIELQKKQQQEEQRVLQLAALSHELKTSLNVLLGFSEAMVGEHLGPINNDAYKDYAGIIHKASEQLLAICERLIGGYEGIAPPELVHMEDVDVGDVFEDVKMLFSLMAEERGIDIQTEIADDFPILKADRGRLTATLNNAVSNAIKYSANGKRVTIKAKLKENRDAVILVIQDEGRGISPENLTHITKPGFRTADARSGGIKGSGLGLFMVEEHMRAMGGTLEIRSQEGIETLVSLIFPGPH